MEGVVAVLALFGVPGVYFFGKTDLGQAIIERIRHGTAGGNDPMLLAVVDELRTRLADVEERLDFAERALTSGADPS
ncbi:MAG: hypothetical protein ABIQ41_03605 [Gemmatimonadales bacterium]